jgi:hypothetical protein
MLLVYFLGLALFVAGLVTLVDLPLWAWFFLIPVVVWLLVMLRAMIAVSRPSVASPIRERARQDAAVALEGALREPED